MSGATGFIGRALCETLRARGLRVRAALRRDVPHGLPLPADEQVVVGELGPATDWSEALDGVDAAVHLAGLAHLPDPAQVAAYDTVNTDATAAFARAAAGQGVRRFVFASSARVLGETSPGRPWSEADIPHPPDAYARSKWDAEQRLVEIASGTALDVVILRPPLVYGPGVKANFLRLMEAVARGWPMPLGALRNRRSLVYVGNLVDAIARCLDHPAAAGRTFLVSDGEDVSTPELIRRIGGALGRPARLWPVPLAVLRGAAALLGRRDDYARLAGDFALDSAAIRTALGWRAPHTLDEGLQETARWFRTAHPGPGR